MRVRSFIVLCLAFLVFIAAVLFVRRISAPRVVGRVMAPDGTEMCLVQEFNWSGEPFTTSFVYRKPGGSWRWFYYDHQDDYWGSSRATLNTNTNVAVFYRGSSAAVTFDWKNETYILHRRMRTDTNASRMPAGWSPAMSVKMRK